MFWKKKTLKDFLPFPVRASHGEYSMILSAHDETRPTKELLDLSLQAVQRASTIDLQDICARLPSSPYYPNIWPGEHYKLLGALCDILKPKYLVEIGTATGLSALCMKKFLPPEGKLITFDIVPWQEMDAPVLKKQDFSDGRLVQFTDNLADPFLIEKHRHYLENASLIFIDATHDGKLEEALFEHFERITFKTNPLIVLDDIRVWSMLKMWREIQRPKLDLTSFGHWSGTGLVQWKKKLG